LHEIKKEFLLKKRLLSALTKAGEKTASFGGRLPKPFQKRLAKKAFG